MKSVLELKWTTDNANLHPFIVKIENALKDIETTLVIILAHTSDNNIAKNINTKISEFLSEQNKIQKDFLEFREMDFSRIKH